MKRVKFAESFVQERLVGIAQNDDDYVILDSAGAGKLHAFLGYLPAMSA